MCNWTSRAKQTLTAACVIGSGFLSTAPGHAADSDHRPGPYIGFRGDGTGVFADASPVLTFSDGTVEQADATDSRRKVYLRPKPVKATNILWRTRMPNWSNSGPIVVGDRVFQMSEPTNAAPILTCLDASSGDVLWHREVDHLDLLEEPERTEIKQLWSRAFSRCRLILRLFPDYKRLARMKKAAAEARKKRELKKAAEISTDDTDMDLDADFGELGLEEKKEPEVDPDIKRLEDELNAEYGKLGIEGFNGKEGWGHIGVRGLEGLTRDDRQKLEKHGCYFIKWEMGLNRGGVAISTYVGVAPSTPSSDGKYVYVMTAYNCVACYDLDGNLRWMRFLGTPMIKRAAWTAWAQPPVLTGGLLLVGAPLVLTALDPETGEVRWRACPEPEIPRQGWEGNRGISPPIKARVYGNMFFAGVPFSVECEHYFFFMDGRVYRVRDGKAVTDGLQGDASLYLTAYPLFAAGKLFVYCRTGKGELLKAVRFRVNGERLEPETVWSRSAGEGDKAGKGAYGFIHGGRFYERQRILDAATGEVVRSLNGRGGMPQADAWTGYCLAGEHIFALESVRGKDAGIVHVMDLDGKTVARNLLSCPPETPEAVERIRMETGYERWADHDRYTGSFHSPLFFAGDRLYVRSRSDLICVGDEHAEELGEVP